LCESPPPEDTLTGFVNVAVAWSYACAYVSSFRPAQQMKVWLTVASWTPPATGRRSVRAATFAAAVRVVNTGAVPAMAVRAVTPPSSTPPATTPPVRNRFRREKSQSTTVLLRHHPIEVSPWREPADPLPQISIYVDRCQRVLPGCGGPVGRVGNGRETIPCEHRTIGG
jgi:hypothetical protein